MSSAFASFLPLVLIVVVPAVIFLFYAVLPPIFALVFCIFSPLVPIIVFGAPLKNAVVLYVFEIIVFGALYALKKRKSKEISKW